MVTQEQIDDAAYMAYLVNLEDPGALPIEYEFQGVGITLGHRGQVSYMDDWSRTQELADAGVLNERWVGEAEPSPWRHLEFSLCRN